MTQQDSAPGESAAGSADAHQAPPPPRPFDELPARPWRGPLTFGVVAATLQMGALLWLAKCR